MQVRKRDTSRIYALKTIRKQYIVQRGEITHTLAERLVLARVNNPFIVPLKFSFQSEQKLYLVLAYVFYLRCAEAVLINSAVSSMVENYSTTCSVNKGSMRSDRGSTARSSCWRLSIFMSSMLSIGRFLACVEGYRIMTPVKQRFEA